MFMRQMLALHKHAQLCGKKFRFNLLVILKLSPLVFLEAT